MKRISIVVFVLVFIAASPLYAREVRKIQPGRSQQEHPIDSWLDTCLNNNPTTVGMVDCGQQAYQMWVRELNSQYQAVRNVLDQYGKETLQKSQRAWLAYRDAEFQTIEMLYTTLEGTMWRPILQIQKINVVKERTLMLKSYRDDLSVQ